ncbi:Protein-lysine N-methyltransferase EFM3 [Exophiala dermatitidis]
MMDISRAGVEPAVVRFYRQYMQQINDLTYPPGSLLVKQDVQDCLYKYFFDETHNKFLPPARYQARVLKRIIEDIEKSCRDPEQDQVSDLLMEHMGHLSTIPSQTPSDEAQQMHVHLYFPPLPLDEPGVQPVLICEARNLLSRGTNVGLRTWEAALHLAWYLTAQKPELVRNKTVLELGAGTGFLSLLCAGHLGASHVVATDGLANVCETMQANADLNRDNNTLCGHSPPEVRQLDWTDQPEIDRLIDSAKTAGTQFDLVIGADITYHPDILRPLAELLGILKNNFPDVVILISATIRSDTFAQFTAICQNEVGFRVVEQQCNIPDSVRYSGFFHSVATPIKIVSLER